MIGDSNSAVPIVELDDDYEHPSEADDRRAVAENSTDAKETAPDAHVIGNYQYVPVCKFFGLTVL